MKLEKLRNLFGQLDIDGMLVTSSANLQYMTGFTGSSGLAVISKERAAFITDFRYTEQAKTQVKGFDIIEHGGSLIQTAADTILEYGVKKTRLRAKQHDVRNICILPSGAAGSGDGSRRGFR